MNSMACSRTPPLNYTRLRRNGDVFIHTSILDFKGPVPKIAESITFTIVSQIAVNSEIKFLIVN